MSERVSKYEKYKQDSRIPCRYGDECYQKNTTHLEKYKHPPKQSKRKYNMKLTPSKKTKLDTDVERKCPSPEVKTNKEPSVSVNQNKEPKMECISSSDSEENYGVSNKKVLNNECISSSDSEQNDEVSNQNILPQNSENPKDVKDNDESLKEPSKDENKQSTPQEQEITTSKPFSPKDFIKSRFLVDMPNDFYYFWDFCKELKPTTPNEALKGVGLELVGPYDVLAGKFKHTKRPPEEYLRHWRYYYDPPEVFTVIKGDNNTGYHIGYFFDAPDTPPLFLVSNHGTKDGVFTKMGDNIFAALHLYLEETKKVGDPFKKMQVSKLLSALKTKAESLNLNLLQHSKQIKERQFKVVAKTFNKIGLVVPYNKKTQLGYRDLAMEDKDLMTLLNKLDKAAPEQKSKYLSDLQPVLTYANIALDECDFGTGVKLGWELLYHGINSLNSTISQFLSNSYRLLNKEVFAKIAEAHMSKRKKGCDLSII